MMANSIRKVKSEARKNGKYLRYRRISTPKLGLRFVRRPFRGEFRKGTFQFDIYSHLNPIFMAYVYAKNLLFFCAPAMLLHGMLFGIHLLSLHFTGEGTITAAYYKTLFVAYAVCAFFALRRINDHMAFYHMQLLVNKYDINRKTLELMGQPTDEEGNKELIVMNHYRKKFMKYSLFPSNRDMALEEQLFEKETTSISSPEKMEKNRQRAINRRNRLNLHNKRLEHIAAKEIADLNQSINGGKNEYDTMVMRYKFRTTPAIREIIEEVQGMPNFYM